MVQQELTSVMCVQAMGAPGDLPPNSSSEEDDDSDDEDDVQPHGLIPAEPSRRRKKDDDEDPAQVCCNALVSCDCYTCLLLGMSIGSSSILWQAFGHRYSASFLQRSTFNSRSRTQACGRPEHGFSFVVLSLGCAVLSLVVLFSTMNTSKLP